MNSKKFESQGAKSIDGLDHAMDEFWKALSTDEKLRNPKIEKKVLTLKRILSGIRDSKKIKINSQTQRS